MGKRGDQGAGERKKEGEQGGRGKREREKGSRIAEKREKGNRDIEGREGRAGQQRRGVRGLGERGMRRGGRTTAVPAGGLRHQSGHHSRRGLSHPSLPEL